MESAKIDMDSSGWSDGSGGLPNRNRFTVEMMMDMPDIFMGCDETESVI